MVTLDKAREWLRLDGNDNDEIIQGLLDAAPDYIHIATGLTPQQQRGEPLADMVTKFLLILWYNAEQSESGRLQRTIDSIIKSLSFKARGAKEDIAPTIDYSVSINDAGKLIITTTGDVPPLSINDAGDLIVTVDDGDTNLSINANGDLIYTY